MHRTSVEHGRQTTDKYWPVKVVFVVVTALLSACVSRGPSWKEKDMALALATGVALAPVQNVVVWLADDKGIESSLWVRGNGIETEIVAARPGIVIPVGLELWEWQETEVAIHLCDCDRWEQGGTTSDCEDLVEPGWGVVVELVELQSGDRHELVPLRDSSDDKSASPFADFSSKVEPIASVGPYLFYEIEEHSMSCGATVEERLTEFAIFDLERREPVEILSAEEIEKIAQNERRTAYELVRGDRLVAVEHPDDLELTAIEPRWMQGGLNLSYQFSTGASFASSKENYGAYTRSVVVPATELPARLTLFAAVPKVLRADGFPVGGEWRVGGFGLVLGSTGQMAALVQVFAVSPVRNNETEER